VGKFGLTEAWIALALLFLIFAEYLGSYIARRVLAPRRTAARKAAAPSSPDGIPDELAPASESTGGSSERLPDASLPETGP